MSSASAQRQSTPGSNVSQSEVDTLKRDNERLKRLAANGINVTADLQEKLNAANTALDTTKKEADDAKNVVRLDAMTIDALHKALDAETLAEQAYKRAYEAEQQAAEAYKHRAESAEARVDKLTDQLSRARKHGTVATFAALVIGYLLHGHL
jgi:chromosome segregation ATPase